MKINYYFYIFLFAIVLFGVVLFPQNRELIYVFEKTDNLPELERLYKSVLQSHYNRDIDLKYVKVLIRLNKKEAANQAERYFLTYKDKNFLNYLLNVFSGKKDYKNYEKFLKIAYNTFNDTSYLEKLISFYSFRKNRKKFVNTLKEIYKKTGEDKWLEALYGIGETDFAVESYLKSKKPLTMKKIKRILFYFSRKKDYKNYVKYLKTAYKLSGDIKYLIEEKNIYSFLKNKKRVIETYKKLFALTGDYKYLDNLYAVGEKDFVIKSYEKNLKNLNLKQKRKLATYYLWASSLKKLMIFFKNEIGYNNLTKDEERRFIALLSFYANYKDLIEFYKERFKTTKNLNYLKALGDAYDYYGIGVPEKVAEIFYKIFKITDEKKYLDRIISMYLALSDLDNYLKYSLIKLDKFYSEKLLKEIVGFLISNNKLKKAEALTEKYLEKDAALFHFLVSLYMMQGKTEKSINTLLHYPAEKLTMEELSFIANYTPINADFFPYIVKYYKITHKKFYIAKMLKYYTIRKSFYRFNRLFKKFFGNVTKENYRFYLSLIPEKFKNFRINEALRFVKISFNPDFLNDMGSYFTELNHWKFALKAYKKALFLDKNNLIALEQIGKIYYSQQNFTKSLKIFREYDRIKSNNPVVKFYIGEILYNSKKIDKAWRYLEYVINHIKKDTLEHKMIYLKAYVMLHGIDEVEDEYRAVVNESGFDRDVYADYVDALLFSKKFKLLAVEYEKFKHSDNKYKNYIRLIRLFAMYNIETENFIEAKLQLDRAYAILKKNGIKNSTIFADYGYFFYQKGDRYKALSFYKKALLSDKKNKDIKKIVRDLTDEFGKNISLTWENKNKVEAEKFNLNIPFKGKYWLGFTYSLYKRKRAEIYLKIQDINKKDFLFEAGKRHFNITFGNHYKIYYRDCLFTDYKAAVDEDLMERKIGIQFNKSLKKIDLGVSLEASKNFYRNKKGKVASTFAFDSNISFDIYNNTYISTGFSYVKLNYFNSKKSNVFFSNYRALNFFLTKYYNYDDKNSQWDWSIGTVYDLISKKYNYAGSINVNIFNRFFLNYDLYYDTFSKEQVDSLQLKWKIIF